MESLEASEGSQRRRKSMDPVSEFIRVEELPDPVNRFVLQERLMTTSCYKMYSAFDKEKGKRVAVKVIANVAENILEIEAEYRVLSAVGGQSLVPKFYGAFLAHPKDPGQELWFVTELHEGVLVSDLRKWFQKERKVFHEKEIAVILKAILMTLHHLHSNDIIHRDVRASNFLLSYDGQLKLMNFGSCAVLRGTKSETHFPVGSPYWMAPEVISCQQIATFSKTCDTWAVGITAIELAEGSPPLANLEPLQAMLQIVRYPPPMLKKPENWTEMFKDFINECLVKCPDSRPCAKELIFHPFIVEGDQTSEKLQSAEEYLAKGVEATMSETGREVLKSLGRIASDMAKFHATGSEEIVPIVKNFYVKKGVDSPFVRMLPDDVTFLENPSEDTIADLLQQRFLNDDIYTYVADILISVNPDKDLSLFKPERHMDFRERSHKNTKPHIFAVGEKAYNQMLHHKCDQTVLFLGEHASGKSFSYRYLINHVAFLATDESRDDIAGKVRQIAPLLDAFGGTQGESYERSRYLKIISVTFGKTGKISGAVVKAMLLDDWRLPCRVMSETNYCVFYYVYEGLKAEGRLKEFGLENLTKQTFLPGKEQRKRESFVSAYKSLLYTFALFSFEAEEIQAILNILSAILLLGDVEFVESNQRVEIIHNDLVNAVSKNLHISSQSVFSIFSKSRTIEEAEIRRDAVSLRLYICLFDWLVKTLNQKMSFSRLVFGTNFSIHLVDAPGVEQSGKNDFFQMCTNILGDYFQKTLRNMIFFKEMEEYKEEGVDLPFLCENPLQGLDFGSDDLDILKTFSVVRSLKEDVGKTCSDQSSVAQSPYVRRNGKEIYIRHVFGEVSYLTADIEGFPKSDTTELSSALHSACDSAVATVFETLSLLDFDTERQQLILQSIKDIFSNDDPHIVICIKTQNFNKTADHVVLQACIIRQMHVFKLVEVATIRQQGYARRIPFNDFLNRYKYLAFDFNEEVNLTVDNCRLLLIRLRMDGWKIGKTKVFLKYYAAEYLSRLYEEHVKKIVKVQAIARRFIVRIGRNVKPSSAVQTLDL